MNALFSEAFVTLYLYILCSTKYEQTLHKRISLIFSRIRFMSSDTLVFWMLPMLGLLMVLAGLSLWLLFQLRTSATSTATALIEQANYSGEIRSSLSKVMAHSQRMTTLIEASAKENTSRAQGLSEEVRLSLSMLNEALVELHRQLPIELGSYVSTQLEQQLTTQQNRLQGELSESLGTRLEEHFTNELQIQLQASLEKQFRSSFDALELSLPKFLREDFTNLFGTELDLIQTQINEALEAVSNASQALLNEKNENNGFGEFEVQTAGSAQNPEEYTFLIQALGRVSQMLEEMRHYQTESDSRQEALEKSVNELKNYFSAFDSLTQEITDIPRLTEQSLRKPIQELQALVKSQSDALQETLPEILTTQTAKVTRRLAAAHSTKTDMAKLEGAFSSLADRKQKKETLQSTMTEMLGAIEKITKDISNEGEQKENTDKSQESMRLAEDLQRLQKRLMAFEEEVDTMQQNQSSVQQRDMSMLESIRADAFSVAEEMTKHDDHKPRLLIVDDSITNLSILKTILHHEIFELTLVKSGNAALDAVADHAPDIVLLDIVLPDIDGYEVCKEIKSLEETQEIPVIFMSGLNDTQAIVKGFEAGGADYVIKPFQKAEIIARLKFHYELYNIRRQQHKYIAQVQHEREKSDQLLRSILPEAIADRLKKGEGIIADGLPNVSVLFADIVGFTKLSARVGPKELVEMLNVVFSAFDTLTEQHGLEKIKTIGDAYMVAGGLLDSRTDHIAAMAELGLQMTQEIERCSEFLGADLKIRIGLHCGEATAGVIGQNKFAYDIWGDTVNTASRMESHGEAGRVHCSATVYEALKDSKDSFAFEERGEMEIKGKGMMRTYFIEQVRHAE
jgi:class 3 adenylate cyclase/CheY-like chemotaxis protein